jgi:hypothetical protein
LLSGLLNMFMAQLKQKQFPQRPKTRQSIPGSSHSLIRGRMK